MEKEILKEEKVETIAIVERSIGNHILLEQMAAIVELSEHSKLNDEFFETASKYINILTTKLDLTPIQVIFLSIFVNASDGNNLSINSLATHFKCLPIRIMQEIDQIEQLIDKGYIASSRDNKKTSYYVPNEVMETLYKNRAFELPEIKRVTINDFFDILESWFKRREAYEITLERLDKDITQLLLINSHLKFVKQINKQNLSSINKVLFCQFCFLIVKYNIDELHMRDFERVFDGYMGRLRYSFSTKRNELITKKLIYIIKRDDPLYESSYKLTNFSKEEILSEFKLNQTNNIQNDNEIIFSDTIIKKELFYNERENKEIRLLENLLDQNNFKDVRQRLGSNGMRKGFACLFYGSPGTGKTETVYQLAKQTGRNIIPINISQIKSKWQGESEQNMKAVFVKYREYVRTFDVEPILLFNEADSIFGRRNEFAVLSSDKTQSSIQNILLEEIENLDGILIATTNLTQSFDSAFERRFIYKIEFDKPCFEAKQSIWKVMMPNLTEEEIYSLATTFDFSGGQIENIVRKYTVHNIIEGKTPSIDELHEICGGEVLKIDCERVKIGF